MKVFFYSEIHRILVQLLSVGSLIFGVESSTYAVCGEWMGTCAVEKYERINLSQLWHMYASRVLGLVLAT